MVPNLATHHMLSQIILTVFHLNSFISVLNKSTRTEEIAVKAIVVATISERKNANRKKNPRPVWFHPNRSFFFFFFS